jgi:DNA polymerase
MFEGAIIEWRFGIRPFRYFCTMMGQRPYITPFTGSMSLGSGADYLGLPQKGGTVKKFIDRNRVSFTQAELLEYGDYCCNDVTLTGGVYLFLDQRIPDDEALLLDLTIKKFTRGKFALDRDVLDEALQTVLDTEAKALLSLDALGLKRIDVTSNPRLASHLQKRGVNVPVKPSPADPTKTTFAFAKTDSEFVALRHHSDPVVALLVETRLLLKSTIERTRLQQFIDIESITSRLPVPLLYYGAHTGRFSGMMGINLQNLPRSSALRKAIIAPPGYKVVSADLSAIEARITAVLAGQWDLVDRFAAGADVYSEFATALYGYEVTNCDATFTERFIGKMCILGLGFGMGVAKFEATLEAMGIPITPELAAKTVALYRRKYRQIPQLWRRMDECVSKMMELQNGLAWYGYPSVGETILTFKQKQMILPNDMPIFYPKLCRDGKNGAQYLNYEGPGNAYWKPLWGGSLTENAVQALARIIISRAELRLARAGLVSALQVHDELVFVVPENTVEQVVKVVTKVLTDPVPWMPRLPLACKVGIGDSYGAAK